MPEAEELQKGAEPGDDKLKVGVPAGGGSEAPLIEGEDEGAEGQAEAAELETAQTDDEREAIRERRRQERHDKKERQRLEKEESRRLISSLQRANQEMAQRLAAIEQRNAGTDIAQLDHAIQQANRYAEEAKSRLSSAAEANDGKALAEANEVYYAARRRAEELGTLKERITQARPTQPAMDPGLVNQARAWMNRNNWYDPRGGDQDSRVVIALDQTLNEEGSYLPNTPEYWQELDARVKKYLPHRAKPVQNNGDRSSVTAGSSGPRIAGTGRDGGSSGAAGGFRLSPERVNALKDAGLWDDPKARERAIQRYRDYDKEHGHGEQR